jgi:hypothetical protein
LDRAVALPSRVDWVVCWPDVQAKQLIVRTTRVPCWWAAVMIEVTFELVQPPQPVVAVPSGSSFMRLPFLSAPTLK